MGAWGPWGRGGVLLRDCFRSMAGSNVDWARARVRGIRREVRGGVAACWRAGVLLRNRSRSMAGCECVGTSGKLLRPNPRPLGPSKACWIDNWEPKRARRGRRRRSRAPGGERVAIAHVRACVFFVGRAWRTTRRRRPRGHRKLRNRIDRPGPPSDGTRHRGQVPGPGAGPIDLCSALERRFALTKSERGRRNNGLGQLPNRHHNASPTARISRSVVSCVD